MLKNVKIKDMNQYRTVWMGVAMVWIVIYHSELRLNYPILNFIKKIGYGGVDIFLFAAGLGNYCSYLKDHSPLEFIKRRINRLAPVFFPFILVWIIVKLLLHQLKFSQVVGNLFGIQGFSSVGGEFNWYLTGIIICYLLTPYLASFVEENRMIRNIILIAFLLLISIAFWNDRRMIISITRLPVYTLGMLFSKYNQKILTKSLFFLETVGFALGSILLYIAFEYAYKYMWSCGLYWYPFILMTPFICHIISLVSSLLVKNKIGSKFIHLVSYVGNYSFEIYLVHIFMFECLKKWLSNTNIEHKNIVYFLSFLFIIPWIMLLRFISNFIRHIFYKK